MATQLSRSIFLEKDETGRLFYELFRMFPEQQKKKVEWKKSKKGKPRSKDSRKQKVECMVEVPPEIEVAGNASSFAVFATVRLAVLERWMKETCEHFHVSSVVGEDSEDESAQAQAVVPLPPIPKIVGVGLRSVFELVRESRVNHPLLCTKALAALLDVLQGHQPEALKNEPTQVVEPLLELLLDLATLHTGEDEASMCLTAVACSCLLALVTARGDTGKILSAVAALLMCPRPMANQTIQLPSILSSLQKSVHGVLLGKTTAPDWITHGIPLKSHLFSFTIDRHSAWDKVIEKTCASDGQYLYILTNKGLFKIGTGYGNTVRGYIYSHKKDFFNDKSVWMGMAHGKLLLVVARGGDRQDLMFVDRTSLQVKPLGQLDLPSPSPSLVFSDGDSLAVITPTKEDGFSMWGLSSNLAQLAPVSELPLKLVQKCLVAFGSSPFDDEASMHTINTGTDDEIVSIASGKEFSLIRTASGKVLYSGKGTALGLKGCVGGVGRWCELVVAKAPRITQVAVGHDSLHAVLLADDGSAYFTGTARRGEDADHNKVRRQPKAVKPKRMMKVESEVIVYAACNNGTTALVSREGQLFMFGKDTVHCDPTTGIVNDLKNVHVTQVALGKAHAVVITNKGHLYSFGINNKGQCGREFVLPMKEVMAMETTVEEEGGEEEEVEETGMCAPGTHKWKQELCMVCTVCRECTGYSISCLSSMRPDRYPGQECGCGEGDSGCSVCGCCRICARENLDNSEMAILGPSGASDIAGMMRLDLIFGGGRQGSRLQDHLQLRLEERKQRQRAKLSAKHSSLKMKTTARSSKTLFAKVSPNIPVSAPGPSLLAIESAGSSGAGNIGNKEVLSEFERDASRVSSLPPSRIHLPTESPVIQVACGLHHTVCLVQSGEVFTFGSNSSGQLGVGDMGMRGGPVQVKIGLPVIQVAAGSNHTVLLTSNGMVYTFGSSQKKQLGRGGVGDKVRGGWQAAPAPVAWVGPRAGRRAAWASASSDQTYVSLDEALINSDSLLTTTVMANSTSIILVPRELEKEKEKNFHCLVINKRDGTCTSYKGKDQVDFRSSVTCLDSTYNVIFSIKRGKISCYSVVASEVGEGDHGWWILSPTLALPCQGGSVVSRSQAALHLLASLDTLASSTSTLHPPTTTAPLTHSHSKVYTRDDFSVVSRFESHGGGWGYSGHSIEAIRFMADTDILLGGFGLFGGRGEYTAKIKLFEIGVDGGEQENDGEVLAETEEIPYECGPRHKYPMLFDEPVHIQANKWYVAWARVSGPSSDCGSSGQGMVTTEDQVVFYFKSSKKSNNGTDVNAGQIPQLLYRVMNQEQQMPVRPVDHSEPFYVLSRQFSTTVTRDGLQSLLALLQWSWNSFKKGFLESSSIKVTQSFDYQVAIQEQERLIYIGKACLRLLRMYSNEIYPSQVPYRKQIVESVPLAECIGDIRALLRQILCDTSSLETIKPSIVNPYKGYVDDIVSECHETFVACYHAFYPTSSLKWTSLCDLLASVNKDKGGGVNELLTGMLSALRCRWVRLRSMFPILTPTPAPISSPSQTLPTVPTADLHHYPILVEQMTYRSHVEGGGAGSGWVLRDVVEKLLDIVTIPVKHHLTSTPVLYSHSLVHNASHLLARIIAELATYSTGISDEVEGCYGRVVHTSPSRFTRTNQSRTWNTGNGSPDAICFSVDRPGVVILGVAVYGGVGTYDYELELLDDQSCMSYDSAHVQRWNSLQSTRGSFGPDDCLTDDIAEIKFDYPVLLRENVKYAVRLRNHGGRTSNGDGGLSSVKGPDGVTFSFSTCSLSFNGTTQTRGQIPYIIYYSKPEESESENKGAVEAYARKVTLNMTGTIVSRCSEVLAVASQRMETSGSRRIGTEVARRGESSRRVDAPTAYSILAGSEVVLTLLPLVMAHISLLTTSDPRCAVQVLTLLQELLPHVSALNLSHVETHQAEAIAAPQPSTHRAWVESDHPYKQATVSHYKVVFPESVQWMSVEFSSECGTAQAEDSLQLYVPAPAHDAAQRYWPVLRRLSHNPDAWPHSAVILPGNEVVFSLETASDYVKDERANVYGFKCLVTGYEWGRQSGDGLQLLETEIAFLAGMCAASLIKKDLQLPVSSVEETEEELELVEETAREVYSRHPTLLGKGLALSAPLTITQALDGTLPYSCHSKERLFLRDFVQCVSGTSGGRLARWLQPESYVEPSLCQLHFASDQVRCGWPVTLTLVTKDQYDDTVHAPNLKVEIKAVPIDKKEMGSDGRRSVRRSFNQAELEENLISQMNPSLDVPYEVTHRDKMSYMAITMMKAYENYSFEELRYLCPSVKRCSENMLVKSNTDGTYNATWTPATVGYYSIITTIDGYNMREGSKVEVKEPPQGVTPPSSVQGATKKPAVQPSRLRRFVAKNSAGLRIRAHPSLQSEQIGIVHLNGTIAFIDEIENDDGVWLRLSQETIRQYCDAGRSDGEAWCLQFNQHLGKTLLMPIAETRCSAVSQQATPKPSPTHRNLLLKKGLVYKVVKCGVSGHNVRKAPSLKAPAVGTLTHGYLVSITDLVVNKDGTWLQLDKDTLNKCLFNWEGDGWCLAMDSTNVYLRPESEKDTNETQNQKKKGYDFASGAWPHEPGSFLPLLPRPTSPLATPFVFGSTSHQAHVNTSKDEMRSVLREPPKSPAVSKWMKSDDAHSDKKSSNKDGSSDISVRESSGTNGNGITPPDTPRKTSRSSSPQISTSSPLPIPGSKNANTQDSISSSPLAYYGSSNKSAAHSPAVGGGEGGIRTINRCVKLGHSAESDTSALSISSLTLDSPQPSSLSSTPSTPRKNTNEQTNLADLEMGLRWQQTGTQTSPPQPAEGVTNAPSVAATFNIPEKPVPSPSPPSQTAKIRACEKEGMSPSMSESLRAIFASFLWHEGLVHDAMACASFLKFHPNLPKQGAQVVTRHTTHRIRTADQRHSVEVSTAGNYLHIKPSTLESLTRSAANANANRQRGSKRETPAIPEETRQKSPNREMEKSKDVLEKSDPGPKLGDKEPETQIKASGSNESHIVMVLPPALKCLVQLWEQLNQTSLQAFATNSFVMSPSNGKDSKGRPKKRKEWKGTLKERLAVCELCGGVYPYPVTYHMRQAHAGCGGHAGGKGYNSGGNFCVGWAGNCGDGGVGGSSWYLVCDTCRDKYLKSKKPQLNTQQRNGQNKQPQQPQRKKGVTAAPPIVQITSKPPLTPSPSTSGLGEAHMVMKSNALFLLELSSGDVGVKKRSPPGAEDAAFIRTSGPFQSLAALGANPAALQELHFPIDHALFNSDYCDSVCINSMQDSRTEQVTTDTEGDASKNRSNFHRSISMGTNGWNKRDEGVSRLSLARKRNSSTCDLTNEGGSLLLWNPSAALQRLVPDQECQVDVLSRPVLAFLLEQHNLGSLRLAMSHALRKATCRVYAMQALDWLVHVVTQPTCLHDLLWWFVVALSPSHSPTPELPDPEAASKDPPPVSHHDHRKDDQEMLCEHPLSDMGLAGDGVHPLPHTFHSLLQSISHLMLLLPPGSALQQMAVRCWGINFTQQDHMFLHRSHVFSNISKILSRSEEEQEENAVSMLDSHISTHSQVVGGGSYVEALCDLTQGVEIKVSSRQAMIGSLTDNSTETFWESGDEDRNKTKSITLTCNQNSTPKMIYVHIDNSRDLANKVTSITFQSGPNPEELYKIRNAEIESRFTGWISCLVLDKWEGGVLRLELKGGDNSLRVRQIRVLGQTDGAPLRVARQFSTQTIQHCNTEAETLRVFRLITSQVFGKLIKGEGGSEETIAGDEETNDLKEHVVGILFSRSKLTHLQKQVCSHIVAAIRKESLAAREEWEIRLTDFTECSGGNSQVARSPGASTPTDAVTDTYCFEMLSMVLALSGSSVGRLHLAQQHGLLADLMGLLHTGSPRVQRQVTALLRRMLPEVTPLMLAHILGVNQLPPTDFTIATTPTKSIVNLNDTKKQGILDVFLSCIAKALHVQVKTKTGKESKGLVTVTLASSIHLGDNVNTRWWLRGTVSRKLAEEIISLIKDMSAGKLSESWARVSKAAIAENIVNLTRLSEDLRTSTECLKSPSLWLALASLCVLEQDHVDRLSSGQWRHNIDGKPPPPRPTCTNHDDGETTAIIQCNVCGSLCAECDRYLHLHRRTRMHHRQVCKEEEEAIRVDLHEGCGRTKLFWALLVADSSTLKALVEFREAGRGVSSKPVGLNPGLCRFCGASGSSGLLSIGNVCPDQECQEHGANTCSKILSCGHLCGGIQDETECLPCLHGCSNDTSLKQDADDMCMICFVDALASAPALQLKCGHVFHLHCCRKVLAKKWAGPRITFSFSQCPICKSRMEHKVLNKLLQPIQDLFDDVRRKALMRLEYEGLDRSKPDPAAYAMDRYAYYVCFKCKKAYYGGEARCEAEARSEFDESELVCGACSDVSRAQMCPKHGADFLEYKCRYCCSVAVFFCFGTTHFCNPCHDDFQRVTNIPKNELPSCPAGPKAKQLEGDECPLHVKHPQTGEEFALGCGVCRNAHTF